MTSAQFIHIETYGKKSAKKAERKNLNRNSDVRQTTVAGVFSEARRDAGFTSHIEQPHAPALLWGLPLSEVEKLTEEYAEQSYTTDKNGKQKRLRSDASILLAGVVSINREDQEIWHDYKQDTFTFLRKKYGDRLKSVIEHLDEANPHIHFYVVADVGEKLSDLHDGKKAVAELSKEEKKNQHYHYAKAMSEFQDDFYEQVSKKYGLDRIGEKPKTRLPRNEYLKVRKERSNANLLLSEKKDQIKDLKNIVVAAEKKGSEKGYEFAIDDFKNKSFLAKVSFSMSKKIKATENENMRLVKKSNRMIKLQKHWKEEFEKKEKETEKLKNDHDLELSEQFRKNKETSKNLYITLTKNEALTTENSKLKDENEYYRNSLEQVVNPLRKEISKLTRNNNELKTKGNKFDDFLSKVKDFYGDKYDDWYEAVFKPDGIGIDRTIKPTRK